MTRRSEEDLCLNNCSVLATLINNNIEEDDDGSYIDKSEDDLSFEADTEVGSLSALLRNQVTVQQRRRRRRKQQQQKRNIRNHKPISVGSVCSFYFVLFLFLSTNPICVSILVFFFDCITKQQDQNHPYLLSVLIVVSCQTIILWNSSS